MAVAVGAVYASVAMLSVGSAVAVSGLVVDYPVLAGQGIRYGLAGVLLLALGHLTRSLSRPVGGDWTRLVALAGVGLAGFSVFLVLALRHADAAAVGVIVGAVPVVLVLIPTPGAQRGPRPMLLLAAAGVVAGAAIVQGASSTSAVGTAYALLALIAEAAFTLLAAPLLPRLGAVTVSAWACVAAGAALLLVAGLPTGPALTVPGYREWCGLIYLAVVVTAVAFVLWYRAVDALGPATAGLFGGLVPVGTLVTASVMDRTWPTLTHAAGTGVVALAVTVGMFARITGPGESLDRPLDDHPIVSDDAVRRP